MIRISIIILLSVICIQAKVIGQDYTGNTNNTSAPLPEKPTFGSKLFFGGGMGAQFGAVTYINASPLVGYRITPKLQAGVRGNYTYLSNRVVQNNILGGSLFSRYAIAPQLFAHVEYEELYFLNQPSVINPITAFLVGGGYSQKLGPRTFLNMVLLYDLRRSDNSPYSSPIVFRMGVTTGLGNFGF